MESQSAPSNTHTTSPLRLLRSGHFVNQPDHYTARRRPEDFLLIWVVAGEGHGETEGVHRIVHPGQVLSFAKGQPHVYGSCTDDPWEIYWAHFDGPLGAKFFSDIRTFSTPQQNIGLDATLRELFEHLLVAQPNPNPGHAEALQHPNAAADGLLHAILGRMLHLLDIRRHHPNPPNDTALDTTELRRFIRQHLDQPMNLDDLAEHTNLSVTHFSRLFRQHFGVSPMHYVIHQRMLQAAQLLVETGSSVKQIALTLGYDDPYYFSRLFKKTTGLSPRQYRQQHRNKAE